MTDVELLLGRYELVGPLGEGGMGEVHLARSRGPSGFKKLVALKLLGTRFKGDDARAESLLREALIGVQLDHENVVQVLDFGHADDQYFIVMEYVRGYSLGHVINYARQAGEPIPIDVVAHIARSVAEALHYVHQVRDVDGEPLLLVHGDVSPSNVLLGADGRIKLTDFGVAALASEAVGLGVIAGKLGYLPPEVLRDEARGQGIDVYGLGVVLYQLLTCELPYRGETLEERLAAITDGCAPVRSLRADCPASLAEVVERAIIADEAERFASAADLAEALDAAVPRQVSDRERHRAVIKTIFSSTGFVRENGDLPTTAGFGRSHSIAPLLAVADEHTLAVRPLPMLRFGLSPALGAEKAREYGTRLGGLITAHMQREVRTVVFVDYRALVDSVCRGEVDLAWMPPLTFVEASDRGAEPLVAVVRNGRKTYDSALLVRRDSGVASLDDLPGKTAAWVDGESAAGYLFAAAEIVRWLGPLDEVFSQQHFHGSHRQVCEAVANGWASVGATYCVRDDSDRVLSSGWHEFVADRAHELMALTFAGPIPGDVIAVRPHLPEQLAAALVKVLTTMHEDERGREILRSVFNAERFETSTAEEYEGLRDTLALVGRPARA